MFIWIPYIMKIWRDINQCYVFAPCYRSGRWVVWARYLRNPAKWRTVAINELKRPMYYRSVRGAIWARQYLLKASKAKLEVSTATKARLAGACPKYRPIIHRSLSLQWLQFLASKDTPNSLPSSWKTMPEAGRAAAKARRSVESERWYPEKILPA